MKKIFKIILEVLENEVNKEAWDEYQNLKANVSRGVINVAGPEGIL